MPDLPYLELNQDAPEPQPPVPASETPAARWDTRMRTFRVRLIRFDRPQSRMLNLRANNEAGARAQAKSRAGRDWRIASVHEV